MSLLISVLSEAVAEIEVREVHAMASYAPRLVKAHRLKVPERRWHRLSGEESRSCWSKGLEKRTAV